MRFRREGDHYQKGQGTAVKNGEKPIANPYVVLREEFDDWAVIFDPDTGRGFGLSPTGVYLWKLLDGKHSVDALLEEVCAHGDNVPEEAEEHIGAFVNALVGEGLVGLDLSRFGLEVGAYEFTTLRQCRTRQQ